MFLCETELKIICVLVNKKTGVVYKSRLKASVWNKVRLIWGFVWSCNKSAWSEEKQGSEEETKLEPDYGSLWIEKCVDPCDQDYGWMLDNLMVWVEYKSSWS